MKIAERTEEAGYRKIRQSLFGLESFFEQQLWPARIGLVAAGLAIAILLGALFFRSGLQLYENWHQTQLLHRATSMLQQGRFSEATKTALELLAQHPDSLPTLYILAEAAEKQNLEETISWREQIARLSPKDPDSQLNLVSAALRFGKLDLARKALDQVSSKDRDRAAFHVVAGWLASAEGNFAEQEEQFAAAVQKEPTNELYQFNLAALQIHSANAQKTAKAREDLERLSKVAPYRTGALRALLNDAVARNDLSAADNFAQQLQMSQEITCGLHIRQLPCGNHPATPGLRMNLVSSGAPQNNRQTTSPSANLSSRVWLRNGLWRNSPNNCGNASRKIHPCGVKRWTRFADFIAQRTTPENFTTFFSGFTKLLPVRRRSLRISRGSVSISTGTSNARSEERRVGKECR